MPSLKPPLHRAVLGKHLQVVRDLLGAGADRSIADASGATPLQLAKRASFAEIVAELEP
jgi:ankyrin repeat protein